MLKASGEINDLWWVFFSTDFDYRFFSLNSLLNSIYEVCLQIMYDLPFSNIKGSKLGPPKKLWLYYFMALSVLSGCRQNGFYAMT